MNKTSIKVLTYLLVLTFFILPVVLADITTYPVQKAICRKGFDTPATPTDCTSELTTSDNTRFTMNSNGIMPAYVNGTWNISLHSDFSIEETIAIMEWRASGPAGQTVIDWYYYNETSTTYQIIGCPNCTSLVKNKDQTDVCNITWIYNTRDDITDIKLEAKFLKQGSKKNILINFFAINLTYFDFKAPSVFDTLPISDFTTNVSMNIEISSNVTDYSVMNVSVNIVYPDSTNNNIPLFQYGATDKYNTSFLIPNLFGRYNLTLSAIDTAGNVNNTETTYFSLINTSTPLDTTPPSVWNVTPKAGTNFSLDSIVDITANVTDNVAVDRVFANLTNPDLSVILLELFDDNGDGIYNNTVIANQVGWYYITIIANDTSGNINNTVTTNFDPATLGGGGGGGGGSAAQQAYDSIPHWRKVDNYAIIKPYSCIESWLCTEWTECSSEGKQTRTCDDWNKCKTEETKPFTEKECEIVKNEKKASKSRFATSLLFSRKQTFTVVGGLGIAAIIVLLGLSIYLLYRKTDKNIKKKNRKRKKVKINMLHRLHNKYKNV